jgi:hypothetical protein
MKVPCILRRIEGGLAGWRSASERYRDNGKGAFFGGAPTLQAKVGIVDPSAPGLFFAEQDTTEGMFGMLTALPLSPPLYTTGEFTAQLPIS